MRVRRVASALVAVVVAATMPLLGSTSAEATTGPLPSLRISGDYVTGISSGGYMATQLQVAYSGTFRGAGVSGLRT
jgi:hypothetical protein